MTVSSKDQVIARLVREVIQSWGPDDLESFTRTINHFLYG